MFHQLLQVFDSTMYISSKVGKRGSMLRRVFFILMTTLLASFVPFSSPSYEQEVHATELRANGSYMQYTIRRGDTLSVNAAKGHIDVLTLARADGIAHKNEIFVAHSLCQLQGTRGAERSQSVRHISLRFTSGVVRWYAYEALERSSYQQVDTLLRRAAAYYGLSAKLVLAIARQESGLQQHVIAADGGIGVMQIMPDTAMSINKMTGIVRDPYKLQDNIFLGAFYLRMLGDSFHWNMPQVISDYNEGPWDETNHGIFNWYYVNNFL